MFLRWCLAVELGVLLSCVLVLAQPININTRNGDNLEELNNHRGQTPCTLNDEITSSCQSSRSQRALTTRDGTITPPIPSACTCNNVFFNIWSACLILHGDATLPVFDDWGSQCRNNSLDLTAGNPDKSNANIPSWAFANVSGSSTFDVNAALSIAKKKGWTTVQIVVPIVVGVGALIAALFGVFLYRRRSRKQMWPAILRCLCLRPRVYKVRKASRSGPWTIDRAEDAEEYFAVDDGERTSSHRSSKGHARLESSSTIGDQGSPDNAQHELPLRSRIAHQLRTLPDHFALPWRDRAIEVRNKPPRQGFRVDSWDVSTLSSPSTVSGAHSRSAPTESSRVGRNQLPDTILEEDEADARSSLISNADREENSVLFIGHRPGNFTMESGSSSPNPQSVQVVPPSPTVSSRTSASHRTQQPLSPTTRTQIPPTPTQPAPLPPSFRHKMSQPVDGLFQTERASQLVQPITPPISRPHSPAVRHNSPDNVIRSPINFQHALPRTSSPVYHSRQLPVAPDVQRVVSPSLPVVGRGLASPSSIESLYIDIRPPSSHQRSSSDLRLTKAHFDPLMMSPPITPGLLLEDEQARRHQISSLSSSRSHPSRSSSPHHRSRTPTLLSPRRRGAHDSTVTLETLYSLDEPHHAAHSRNVSSESIFPDRGDPVMLFPGSVRAAGYAPHSPTYYDNGI